MTLPRFSSVFACKFRVTILERNYRRTKNVRLLIFKSASRGQREHYVRNCVMY